MRWTVEQISNPSFAEERARKEPSTGEVTIILPDGAIKLGFRMAILNIIFWEPLFHYNIMPTTKDVIRLEKFKRDTPTEVGTVIYKKILAQRPEIYYMDVVEKMWQMVNRLYTFSIYNCSKYHAMTSMLDLAMLLNQPVLVDFRKKVKEQLVVSKGQDVKMVELRHEQLSAEFIAILNNDVLLPFNPIKDMLVTGNLKVDQLPQMMIAYGTRSDVDKTIMQYAIRTGAVEGIQNIKDFAIEHLSAKKAMLTSKSSISDSQYFHRRLKLVCAALSKFVSPVLDPNNKFTNVWCGNTKTIPVVMIKKHSKNYIDKIIVEDGKRITLDSQNIDNFVDRRVEMVTPLTCRSPQGCCAVCAGRGHDDAYKFLPPDIHIGIFGASKLGDPISQQILSVKHLIKTDSKTYNIPASAYGVIEKDANGLYLNPNMKKCIKELKIRIPLNQMSPLSYLTHDTLPEAEAYSNLSNFEILNSDKVIVSIDESMNEFDENKGVIIPYLSDNMLTFMAKTYNNIHHDSTHAIIPLGGFNIKSPLMNFTFFDDDVAMFAKGIDRFFTNTIQTYTTLESAVKDITDKLYTKVNVNMFFVEMTLKAYLITNENDYRIPTDVDINNCQFSNEKNIMHNRSVVDKLAYQYVWDYITSPDAYIKDREKGHYKDFFAM